MDLSFGKNYFKIDLFQNILTEFIIPIRYNDIINA